MGLNKTQLSTKLPFPPPYLSRYCKWTNTGTGLAYSRLAFVLVQRHSGGRTSATDGALRLSLISLK